MSVYIIKNSFQVYFYHTIGRHKHQDWIQYICLTPQFHCSQLFTQLVGIGTNLEITEDPIYQDICDTILDTIGLFPDIDTARKFEVYPEVPCPTSIRISYVYSI